MGRRNGLMPYFAEGNDKNEFYVLGGCHESPA